MPLVLPNLARIVAMRAERRLGWSHSRIGTHHDLSPERVAQLIEREPLKARVYGPWVVFNDIPFLITMRPAKEKARKAYMRDWRASGPKTGRDYGTFTGHPNRSAHRREMDAYWQAMVVRYSEETGTVLVNKDELLGTSRDREDLHAGTARVRALRRPPYLIDFGVGNDWMVLDEVRSDDPPAPRRRPNRRP